MSKEQANFITFKETVERKIIKEGDKVNINALYPEDSKKAILYPEETGYEEKQVINREKELDFFFVNDEKGIPTFWGNTTFYKVYLQGKQGAENAVSVINKACQPWSNLKNGLKARATETRDIYYLRRKEETKVRLNEYTTSAWLGSPYVYTKYGYASFGVRGVNYSHANYYNFFFSYGIAYGRRCGVRPAVSVYLPNKILVDIQKSKETGIWQLIPNE